MSFWLQRGHIKTSQGSFFIEPVEKYPDGNHTSPILHLMYRIPSLHMEPTNHCGLGKLIVVFVLIVVDVTNLVKKKSKMVLPTIERSPAPLQKVNKPYLVV